MTLTPSLGRTFTRLLVLAVLAASAQAACGQAEPSSVYKTTDDPSGTSPSGSFGPGTVGEGSDATVGELTIDPPLATVTLTSTNGVLGPNTPVVFKASYQGQTVTAEWLVDRGELGDVDGSGTFKASGTSVGEATITARYGAREGAAKVRVVLSATQNGTPDPNTPPGGFGGLGGVGGEPLGEAVSDSIASRLKSESNPPQAPSELGFLYPYDKTVWPRGLLPPLVMWQSTREASAVYVKLSQGNYTFEGTYSLSQHPAGSDARKRVRLEDIPWRIATSGNEGDDLTLTVKIHSADDDKVYGPITESWRVAPGVLKGTVYYNSYDSLVTTGGTGELGGVIAIKPRSPDPVLAIPSMAGKCHVCHTVSADGSTLFAQDGRTEFPDGPQDYANGASYDLKNPGNARTVYDGVATPANNRKFTWSAPFPDGSFALVSSRFTREAYLESDAKLFSRADASEMAAVGLATIQSAVTPSFSPDGKKVAFNFWEGAETNGVLPGNGHTLAVVDFDKATSGFSAARQVYKDDARYPAWPSFVPDGKAIVFHNTVQGGTCGADPPDRTKRSNCQLTTWFGATSEIWMAADGASGARRLDALNGVGYVPTSATHLDDSKLNYMPTVNPVASGGYYWVVFTSRRLYGNVLVDHPFTPGGSAETAPTSGSKNKKLWVAAIDMTTGNVDPSHPAFYLPGQELMAGNSRGFWAVDPCKSNGQSCESGDECCNGFCRKDGASGALVCQDKPPLTCAQEFERCTMDADCCNPKQKCINNRCASTAIIN